MSKKREVSPIRSSAAEYLTFVAATGQGGVEAVYADENVWLSQKMMGQLYDVETHTINYHLKRVFADSELQEDAVIRNFRITAADGKTYATRFYLEYLQLLQSLKSDAVRRKSDQSENSGTVSRKSGGTDAERTIRKFRIVAPEVALGLKGYSSCWIRP